MSEAAKAIAPARPPKPPSAVGFAFRVFAWSIMLGFVCAGIFALAIESEVGASVWLAVHLASSPQARSLIATGFLTLVQAAISFGALALLALLFELLVPTGIGAASFAASMPILVPALAIGLSALHPISILLVRVAGVFLSGALGGVAVRSSRNWIAQRKLAAKHQPGPGSQTTT